MFDIITIGSATIDVFVDTEIGSLRINHKKIIGYPSGTKILIHDFSRSTGGGGTNTAVGFARMGLKTGFIGKLGSDENGKAILMELLNSHLVKLDDRIADLTILRNEITEYQERIAKKMDDESQ